MLGAAGTLALAAAGTLGACTVWEWGGGRRGPAGSAPALVFGSQGDIVVLSPDGRARRQLTKVASGAYARDPAWSPDGARIAYAYTPPLPAVRGPGGLAPLPVTDLYVMNADGSDQKVLVPHDAPGVGYETPIWAPDGRAIYATYTALVVESNVVRDQVVEVARVPLGGGTRQTLASNAMFPALSPDGRRLAFITSGVEGLALIVADTDGKNARVVVPPGPLGGLAMPRFSPDGREIVFAAVPPPARSGGLAPSVAAPTGAPPPSVSLPAALATGGRSASASTALANRPAWLRVAQAMTGMLLPRPAHAHGLPMDLFAVQTDGSNLRRLTELYEDSPAAAWSPDGRQLAMLAGGGVYLVTISGAHPTAIDTKGGHGAIDWKRA